MESKCEKLRDYMREIFLGKSFSTFFFEKLFIIFFFFEKSIFLKIVFKIFFIFFSFFDCKQEGLYFYFPFVCVNRVRKKNQTKYSSFKNFFPNSAFPLLGEKYGSKNLNLKFFSNLKNLENYKKEDPVMGFDIP